MLTKIFTAGMDFNRTNGPYFYFHCVNVKARTEISLGSLTPGLIEDAAPKQLGVGASPFGSVCLGLREDNYRSPPRNKTTELRSPGWGGLGWILFKPWSVSFAVRAQPSRQPEQIALISAAWQQAAKVHSSIRTIWSRTSMYCCRHAALLDRTPIAPLFYLFTHSFIAVVCAVQHLAKCRWDISPPICTQSTCNSLCVPWRFPKMQPGSDIKALGECVSFGPFSRKCMTNTNQTQGNMQTDLEQIVCFRTKKNSPGVKRCVSFLTWKCVRAFP